MSRKLKFKPEITRAKLNPEQAMLACDCFSQGRKPLSTVHQGRFKTTAPYACGTTVKVQMWRHDPSGSLMGFKEQYVTFALGSTSS